MTKFDRAAARFAGNGMSRSSLKVFSRAVMRSLILFVILVSFSCGASEHRPQRSMHTGPQAPEVVRASSETPTPPELGARLNEARITEIKTRRDAGWTLHLVEVAGSGPEPITDPMSRHACLLAESFRECVELAEVPTSLEYLVVREFPDGVEAQFGGPMEAEGPIAISLRLPQVGAPEIGVMREQMLPPHRSPLPSFFRGRSNSGWRDFREDSFRSVTRVDPPHWANFSQGTGFGSTWIAASLSSDGAQTRLCHRGEYWRCTEPRAAEYRVHDVLITGDVIGLLADSDEDTFVLDLWSRSEMDFVGRVLIGSRSREEREGAQFELRSRHDVWPEGDCLRFDHAWAHEAAVDPSSDQPMRRGSQRFLPGAGERVSFGPASPLRHSLAGLWRVGAEGLERVQRCGSVEASLPPVPSSLPAEARECLERAQERARAVLSLPAEPVAAPELEGALSAGWRTRGPDRIGLRVHRPDSFEDCMTGDPWDPDRLVYIERHEPQGPRRRRVTRDAVQFMNGQQDCVGNDVERWTLNAAGWPIAIRHFSSPCEGEERRWGPTVLQYTQREQFVEEQSSARPNVRRYLAPSPSEPVMSATCEDDRVCRCEIETRDAAGALILQLETLPIARSRSFGPLLYQHIVTHYHRQMNVAAQDDTPAERRPE